MKIDNLSLAQSNTSRNSEYKETVIYRCGINTYPQEEDGAKMFAKFMMEHPEYSMDDVRMRLVTKVEEEDYHGHGGGVEYTLEIYQETPETDNEIKERISAAEKKICIAYSEEIGNTIGWFYKTLTAYVPLAEIPDYQKKVFELVKKITKDKLGL